MDFEADAAALFTPVNETMGEDITYTPSGGSASTITAIVIRGQLVEKGRGQVVQQMEIIVSMDDVPTVKTNGDRVALKRNRDDAANSTMTVTHVVNQDGNAWRLVVT